MPNQLAIRPEDQEIVVSILRKHLPLEAVVWVLGSRARGTLKRAADLDLAIDLGRLMHDDELLELELAFEDSALPYRVDVVDLGTVSGIMRENIQRDRVVLTWH